MPETDREYDYLPRWSAILPVVAVFGLCCLALAHRALTNEHGLAIPRLIALSRHGATLLYWIASAACLGPVAAALSLAAVRIGGAGRRKIVLTPTGIILPASRWSNELRRLDYRSIASLSLSTAGHRKLLSLACADERYTIAASFLPSAEAFDEICLLLVARVRNGRPLRPAR